ncbi:MAG: NAD-dependent epimerase/dehydratase family protein [Planctomycetota bacterium]|jgi:nucleoside-diphosphate-sugar epimerase
MRVLVTGHRGYIGSVLTCVLRHSRFDVIGLDCDIYDGCGFGRIAENIPSFDTDIRDIQFSDLVSFDAIVHLAALPDPQENSKLAAQVSATDHAVTLTLAELARQAGVPKFLFASSSAVYGRSSTRVFEEEDAPQPVTALASSKVASELGLLRMASPQFQPVILRIGEVYGVSPRLRLDQVVNDMVSSSLSSGRVTMRHGLGGWRSLIHVEDLARAMAGILKASPDAVAGQVFNLSRPNEHYRLVDIADTIMHMMPLVTRSATQDCHDHANLRTNGSKLARTFTEFAYRWSLPMGIRQLLSAFHSTGMAPGDCRSDRYRRSLRFQSLVNTDALDASFRSCAPPTDRAGFARGSDHNALAPGLIMP